MKRSAIALLATGASAIPFCAAFAQTPAPAPPAAAAPPNTVSQAVAPATDTGLQDIVVTAQRTESRLQTTPLAVTALNSSALKRLGVTGLESLANVVPGVSFGEVIGQAHVSIRGVGTEAVSPGGDPRIAYYQDGVYYARPTAQTGGLYDIDQLQVLKGPQGTLYGRNATGGALVVTSARPSETSAGYANLSYGNYNEVDASGAITGAIASGLAARIAVDFKSHDGYGRNIVTGNRIDNLKKGGVRASLAWEVNNRLEFLLIGDYARQGDKGGALHYIGQGNPSIPLAGLAFGGLLPTNRRDYSAEQDSSTADTIYGVTLISSYKFDWGNFKSVTGYRHSNASFGTNTNATSGVPGTGVPLGYVTSIEVAHQVSEEVQLDGSDGRFKWLFGTLLFKEHADDDLIAPLDSILFAPNAPNVLTQGFFTSGGQDVTSVAPYARLTYQVTPRLSFNAGGRYTYERRRVDQTSQLDPQRPFSPDNPIIPLPGFPISQRPIFKSFVPTLTADYQFSTSFYGYATYGQGFKSGGINIGEIAPPFKPEKNTEYELGLKFKGLDGKAQINLDAFYYDYRNLQVSELRGLAFAIENAASADLYGLDVDFALLPLKDLRIDGGIALLHSKYKDFASVDPAAPNLPPVNLSGNQLTNAPRISGRVGAQYTIEFTNANLVLRADATYRSRNYFTPFNKSVESQRSYGLVNSSIAYESPSRRYTVGVYGRNLFNKTIIAQSYVSSSLGGAPVLGVLEPPRTFGISLAVKF